MNSPRNGKSERASTGSEFHFLGASSGIQRAILDPVIGRYRSSALEILQSGHGLTALNQILEGCDQSQLDDEHLRLAISPRSNPVIQKRVEKNSTGLSDSFAGSWESGSEEAIETQKNKYSEKGVIFTDLLSAENLYSKQLAKVLGKVIRPGENQFTDLTAGLGQFGAFLYVPAGVKIEEPFYYQNNTVHPGEVGLTQLLVFLDPDADIKLIHNLVGGVNSGGSLQAGTAEIILERGAKFHFYETVDLRDETWLISQEKALVGENAELTWNFAALGNRFHRQILEVDLAGKSSRCNFSGFSITGNHQHFEVETRTRHQAPYSESKLNQKNVLFEDGKVKWRGMIKVEPEAVHSDGYQGNRNLILSNNASIDAIPGLEILTDEVRCSHGSTTSRIDPEEMFYLQSRGISEKDSEKILVEGFIEPILKKFPEKPSQEQLIEKIQKKVIKKIL